MLFPLAFLVSLLPLLHAECASKQIFDYVIVGGGPAGLLLANRLSENPETTVAVVEAGDAQRNNPNVTRVDLFFPGLNTPIDWAYPSAPQKYTQDRVLIYNAGRALGGTTTINGMTYLRAEKEQIDQWQELGNQGWNWDSLYPYYVSQEHFQPPDPDQAENGATFAEQDHGLDGEVAVGWSDYFMKQGMFDILKETSENMGVRWNNDANGGRMKGFTTWPFTLNSSTSIRQDAARSFYYPIADQRPNLHLFLNTTVTRIIWGEKLSWHGKVVAKGVETTTSSNSTETLSASGEVILSAGSLRSPAILEHSGVGNTAVLQPLGVNTKIDLPSVGANLQDQPNAAISYASPTNWTGYPSFVTYLTSSDLFGTELRVISDEVRANISQYAERIVADAPANSTTQKIEEQLLRKQANLVFSENSTVPLAELIWFPLPGVISCAFWTLLPFSRGSIHITSSDPTTLPSIDPNFMQLPIDAIIYAATAVKVREYFATTPLSSHVSAEIAPNTTTVPASAGWRHGGWAEWLDLVFNPNNHPVSSCAMRSREFGGVVDAEGKLYGSANVRVVDGSIFPMQISGHLSASIYAIAEKIADAITGVPKGKRH